LYQELNAHTCSALSSQQSAVLLLLLLLMYDTHLLLSFILPHNFLFIHNAGFSYTKNCARRLAAPISGMLRCRNVGIIEVLPHARWDARCSRMGKVKI